MDVMIQDKKGLIHSTMWFLFYSTCHLAILGRRWYFNVQLQLQSEAPAGTDQLWVALLKYQLEDLGIEWFATFDHKINLLQKISEGLNLKCFNPR